MFRVTCPAFLLRHCDKLQEALLSVTSLDNTSNIVTALPFVAKKEALILLRARLAIKPRNVPVVRFTSVRVKLQEKLPRAIVPKSCTR